MIPIPLCVSAQNTVKALHKFGIEFCDQVLLVYGKADDFPITNRGKATIENMRLEVFPFLDTGSVLGEGKHFDDTESVVNGVVIDDHGNIHRNGFVAACFVVIHRIDGVAEALRHFAVQVGVDQKGFGHFLSGFFQNFMFGANYNRHIQRNGKGLIELIDLSGFLGSRVALFQGL